MTNLFTSFWNIVNLQSVLFGLVIGGLVYYWLTNRKYNLPPGPIVIPLIGNVVSDVWTDGGKNITLAKYGDTLKYHRRVTGKALSGRLPTLSGRKNHDYIESCLYETMRMGTVAPVGVPHETVCDTEVGGYDVPKGTTVMINHWALHHDPKAWDNVDKFEPQRYLDAEGKLGPKPESWLPFSAGRRGCLGEPVAKVELMLICSRLLQRFVFKLPTGSTASFEDNSNPIGLEPVKYEVLVEDRMRR